MKKFTALLLIICAVFTVACKKNEVISPTLTPSPSQAATPVPTEPPHVHTFKEATCKEPMICTGCNEVKGDIGDHIYVAGECKFCRLFSDNYIPKIFFEGDLSLMATKSDVREVTFEFRSKEKFFSGAAKIKLQGSSSLRYEKKNYTIDLYESTDFSQKLKIDVGWGKESKYCLKANWIDKTHSRNVVTARLASQVQKKYGLFTDTPNNAVIDGFPVEIYVNGSFHGLYTMNIPKDSWMFNMDDSNPDHIVVCGEDWLDSVLFNEIPTDFSGWSVEVGSQSPETLKKLQRLIRFVKESSDKRFKRDFGKYLDLDSTLNYYVMMNYCWMPDNVGKNMLMATYDGKVWYPSLYDLDTTWGTSYDGTYLYNYKNRSVSLNNSLLWIRLEQNFSKEIAERYFELRETVLDPRHVINTFNEFYSGIPQEVLDRETAKWSTQDTHIPGYPLTQIQKYLDTVVPYLDNKYSEWK